MERWRPTAPAPGRWLWQQLRRSPARLRWLLAFLRKLPRQVKAGAAVTVVLLLVVGSFLFVRNPSGPFGKIEPLPPNAATLTQIPVLGPGHRYLFFPVSGRVTAGLKYRYVLLTHCGLDYPTGPDFDGSFWDSVDPTQRNKFTNPPPGFARPEDDGYMLLASSAAAESPSWAGGIEKYPRRTKGLIAGDC